MADLAGLLRLERLKKRNDPSTAILFLWIQIEPCVIVGETRGCDVFIMSRPAV